MPHIDVVDTRIITYAHEFVEGWRRSHKRRPFTEALHEAEGKLWGPCLTLTSSARSSAR